MQDESIQLSEFLNATWGHAVAWFAILWAVLWFIRKVTKDADDDLNPEKRKALGDELLRIKDRDVGSWVPDFTAVFDRFFGKKHLSWRCLYRSSLISMITFTVLLSLYYPSVYTETFFTFMQMLVVIIFSGLTFNVLLDYMSLLQTRIILNVPISILPKIILDGILTTLLSILWVTFMMSVLEPNEINSLEITAMAIFDESLPESTMIRVVLATSFTTSIWLWLHGLSVLVIRSLSHLQKFMGWLNVKEAPLRAIGTTINLIVLTFGVLLFPIYLLY